MRLCVLGPIRIQALNGSEVQIVGARQRKILATLALSPNRPVTVSRLIDVVWPESPPATARIQVQNCLGLLRRQLREHSPGIDIHHQSGGYVLGAPADLLDLSWFDRLCVEGANLEAAGDRRGAHEKFQLALDLWCGDALENVDTPALQASLISLQERHSGIIARYVDLTEQLGLFDHGYLVKLRAWAGQFPYRQDIHAALARSLRRVGRSADALEALRQFRHRMRDDLGLDADDVITNLELSMLRAGHSAPRRPDTLSSGEHIELEGFVHAAIDHLVVLARSLKNHRR